MSTLPPADEGVETVPVEDLPTDEPPDGEDPSTVPEDGTP